jgi:tetratricopeptide (TPR) repeat protein
MFEDQGPRRVIPRWRNSSVVAMTAEARTKPPSSRLIFTGELANKQLELDLQPTVPIAAELMFLARQAGNVAAATRAARVIVDAERRIGSSRLVAAAKRILSGSDPDRVHAQGADFIREARRLLKIDFRNPVLLMDTARELTALGHHKAALRYVRSAMSLAPHSRFVVRSAARYFLHIGDHLQAHEIVRRSPILGSDPWVQAAEIAIATVRGRTSALVKNVERALSSTDVVGVHLTELATAVATVELQEGANRKAKHLFQKALAHPTDNSLAQAEWAAAKLKLVVDEVALSTPLSFEANSQHAYRKLLLPEAVEAAKSWSVDEPFASRPFDALCYYLSLEGRYSEAQEAVQKAIRIDGGEAFSLELNLLFTRIQMGEVDTAYEDILRLSARPEAKQHAAHMYANAGALAYTTGDFALARSYYLRAIQIARAKGSASTEALARAFFARAAAQHCDPSAEAIVKESTASVMRLPSPGAIYVMRSLVDAGKQDILGQTASARVARRRWEWDAATNTLRALE